MMTRRRAGVELAGFAVLALVAFLLSAAVLVLGSGPVWSQSPARGGNPSEVTCPFDASRALLPVTCGRLKVPENPERPGRMVEIAYMVVKAPRTLDRHGPVVFLNGGPGEISLHYAEQLVTHPHIRDVVVDRDWIFLDQRGAGRSTPSLSCAPQADWLTEVRTCRDRLVGQGIDLSQYNSARIAGDLEALREALGVAQWNLWGISYGARLAVVSARAYPASVRSIILDAPGVPEGLELIDDARGTEVALNKIFAKCAADSACASAYPQLRNRFIEALPRLRQNPLTVGDRPYDDTALLRFIRNWLYPRGQSTLEQRIQSLLAVMDAAARGNGRAMHDTQLRMRAEEGLDTRKDPPLPPHGRYSLGLNLSVYCHESAPFESIEDYERAVAGSAIRRALLQAFGDDSACTLWPAGRAADSARTGVYDGPQLVFTGELDASSSGSAGFDIAKLNANARHVVFRNGMHGQWPTELPTPEDTGYRMCALALGGAFLADPERRLDTRCAETRPLRLVARPAPAPKPAMQAQPQRMAYDSAKVRRLTGNYRIAPDRVISMGPLDEAGGWLAFFDSKTLRGGLLYALSDTVFYAGPGFGVDSPIVIRATVRSDARGRVRALLWQERGAAPRQATRLDDQVSEDVTFNNGAVRLAGTVTLPKGAGPHPAVILIHGAGVTVPTRDFGYWSSYLAGHGLAVLAFDKRGGGASTGDANLATYEDLADDVLAGLRYLQSRGDIAPGRIGLYGTSNGGYIAPLAAARSGGRVAFVTVRSGSARRVGDNIAYELGNDLRGLGYPPADVARAVAIRQRVTDFVLSHPTVDTGAWDSLKAEVSAVSSERWFPWSRVLWVPRVDPKDSMAVAFLNKLRAEWQYDPLPYWRMVRAPVYIMLGGLDRSVPTAESAPLLREALAAAGNRDATVRVFDEGNHGLLQARTGYDSEARGLSHYVPGFQDGLMRWIKAHTAGGPP